MAWIKRALMYGAGALGVVLVGGGSYVGCQVSAFNSSMEQEYEVSEGKVEIREDPDVLARGQHLAESLGGCIECHGTDLGGKVMADMGPVGLIRTPNITSGKGGKLAEYTDGQLYRLLKNGIKNDGTGATFMPAADFRWWPDKDIAAVISWLRKQPAIDRTIEDSEIGLLGKVLDRLDLLPIDVARRIDHEGNADIAPEPEASAKYGAYIAKLCQGCHGPTLSGGPIPGAPPDMPVPTNLTLHESGLADYTEASFIRLLNEGIRPDGSKLDPFMPIATTKTMNDTEKTALWLYLESLEPKPFGGR